MPEFETSLYVYKRPGCDKFLEYMRTKAEGVIFSTGAPFYVDTIMDLIDKDRTAFKHRIYQDQCNRVEYQKENIDVLVKDLNLIGRDLNRTVLIDTKPFSFWCNPDNSIPVQEFRGSTLDDTELDTLTILLEELRTKGDVRAEVTKRFQVRDSLKECNML